MTSKQSSFVWFFCFTIIFLLGFDFWSWQSESELYFLNFPGWIFYFIGLQIILSIVLYLFNFNIFQKQQEEE